MRTVPAPPLPAGLIEAMRAIGYSLETAVADLIDNSITAGAKNVHVLAEPGETAPSIAIVDDGVGMTERELLTAMQPGCRDPLEHRSAKDLGRFGLGLKTASFSQCRRLTVVTRQGDVTSAARWDLDYVAKVGEWLVQIPEDTTAIPWIDRLGPHGTLVIWERLDRLVEQDRQNKGQAYFTQRIDDTCRHLELVFNRFLAGERGLARVQIHVNERPLEAFDPFHKHHPATIIGQQEIIRVDGEDVRVQVYTLPHHRNLPKDDWERLGGPEGHVRNQGFYVFREKRLILHGTWFGLTKQAELTKLVRVCIDIPNGLDARWRIDVKKASAQLPLQVRTRLRELLEPIVAGSKRVYTSRGAKLISEDPLPVWNRIKEGSQIRYRLNPNNPLISRFKDRLPAEMQTEFGHILEIAGASLPVDALFADLGGHPQEVDGDRASDGGLEYFVRTIYMHLVGLGHSVDVVEDMIRATEPCRLDAARTDSILKQLGEGAASG